MKHSGLSQRVAPSLTLQTGNNGHRVIVFANLQWNQTQHSYAFCITCYFPHIYIQSQACHLVYSIENQSNIYYSFLRKQKHFDLTWNNQFQKITQRTEITQIQ